MSMDLREASLGFYRVWHAAVGIEAGLLDARWRTPAQLARALDAAMVERWCRGAHALGLLEARGGRYRLAPAHRRTLSDPRDPAYLGAHFRYLARKSLHFGALPDLLGGKADRRDLAEVYALATAWDHLAFFELVLPRERETRALLSRGADVLDLGAGLGAWSREAARRFPRSRVVAAETREALARVEHTPRVALDDVPPGAFDVVFLGEVVAAAGPQALATARRALRPGGRLHLLEGLAPRPEKAPRGWGERLVLAMGLDFALDGSRFPTVPEMEAALREAGFVRRRIRDLGGSLYHVAARKRRAAPAGRGAARKRQATPPR